MRRAGRLAHPGHRPSRVDVLGGYDFGLFRVEGELGYKRASVDEIIISSNLGGDGDIESDGSVRVLSAMANARTDPPGHVREGSWKDPVSLAS